MSKSVGFGASWLPLVASSAASGAATGRPPAATLPCPRRVGPCLGVRFPLPRRRDGNRSTRQDHPRLQRLQAPELHEHEVEAEHARPARGAEVLPLVRQAHPAPGDPLGGPPDPSSASCASCRHDGRRSRAARRARPPRRARPTARAESQPSREPRREPRSAPGGGVRRFIGGVVGRAQEGRVAGPEPAHPGRRGRADRLPDRRRLLLHVRPRLQAPRSNRCSPSHVPLVRDQHLLRPREQGEDQSRAPDHVHEPGAALPSRRRPDRAGDRDEGGPEGPDGEARAAGLRAREHGHDRRGLDGREEHARGHRLRRRGREARAARADRGRPHPAHRPRRRRAPARPGRVLARRVGEGNLRPALGLRRRGRRRQRGPAEAEGARRHLRAPGPRGADLRPGARSCD